MEGSQTGYGRLVARVTMPAAVLVGLSLLCLLVLLWLVAGYQTSVAQQEQARLAESALAVRGEEMEKVATDYGAWDEAVEKLVDHPDRAWSDENIGASTQATYGLDMTFVVRPDGTASYAVVRGEPFDRPVSDILAGGFDTLLAHQRTRGSEGATAGLVLAQGQPAIAVIVPIRPQLADATDATPRHQLVFVDVVDPTMIASVAHVYRLPGLHLAPAPQGEASVPLVSADGRLVAALAWDGARPGDRLLELAVPGWAAVALAFGALTALFVRQTRSAARAVAESERRASHDALTGLPNRVLLFERLDRASRRLAAGGEGFAVGYLDLDGFKAVNDSRGHEAGDEVLREVARRLEASLGARDFAARLGGDEFAVILPGLSHPREALAVGRRIIAAIEQPIMVGDGERACISATVGVTFAPADGADPLTLLRNADQALYLGKRQAKGEVRFHAEPVAGRLTA
ncbi:diguanylate cyclase domain-containing protein [Aureimonas sp. AU4]|uniref:diguanylate cyclase domain-containing protein n=1 Tax=Aureimonas sp. AU4 TaxID=1638163 RepID=UPI000785C385|nr:diguanylate cyclase [Aureimonas sp. AU4]